MNTKRVFRQIHYWLSLAVMIPSLIIISAGIVLMLKKEVAWIQPATQSASEEWQAPVLDLNQLVEIAATSPNPKIGTWQDIKKIDVRPKNGIAKLIANSGWETQINIVTGEIMSVQYRRSDLIESIHDGSFFHDRIKLYLFLPTGVLLLVMWVTGVYLFFIPRIKKYKKKSRKTRN